MVKSVVTVVVTPVELSWCFLSEDIAFLEIYTVQGHEYFIMPIIDRHHIRSKEAGKAWGCYKPTVDMARRDRESMQSVVHKVQRLHAAKGNEQGELAEDRLINVEYVCVCIGAVNLKAVHGSSGQDWNVRFGELA